MYPPARRTGVLAVVVPFGIVCLACQASMPTAPATTVTTGRSLHASPAPSSTVPPVEVSGEAAFLAENDVAMTRMMNDMAVKPTGDVDRDFVAMMIPHHQGAVDMAQAVLRYGKNEQLRRIAQEIVVEQLQEIAAMRLSVDQALPPPAAAPTGTGSAP
jgi:hypothetical protein